MPSWQMDIGLEDGYVKDLQMPFTKEEKSEEWAVLCFVCIFDFGFMRRLWGKH